jgi:transposase
VEKIKTVRRQIIEIPVVPVYITEYQSEVKKCPVCSRKSSSPFPDEVKNTINFGQNVKAIALYFHAEHFIPYDRLVQLFHDLYGLDISPATIEKFKSMASASLDSYENEVRMKLLEALVLHADETGFYVKGKRWWLHSLSTDKLTYYGVHQNRGSKAIKKIELIPNYSGVLVHDFWQSYAKFSCSHAYCNAHLIRELQGIYDLFGQEWAKKMIALLRKMFHLAFRTKVYSDHEVQELLEEYDRLIIEGELANPPPPHEEEKKGRPKKTKGGNLVERMKVHKHEILRFFTTRGKIPFTNNQAERDVRMMKVQQKISGAL